MALLVCILAFHSSCRDEGGTFDYVSLQRTQCYGGCPAYAVRVYADGRVQYDGGWFVRVMGRQTTRITADQRDALNREIRQANYFHLRDSYQTKEDGCTSVWTDLPLVRTTVLMNGRSKSILHYLGCSSTDASRDFSHGPAPYPPELGRFEQRVDEILRTDRWARGAPSASRPAAR